MSSTSQENLAPLAASVVAREVRSPRRPRGGSFTRNESVAAWLLLLPFLIVTLLFTLIPTVVAIGTGMTDMKASDLRTPWNVNFVGFDVFASVLANPGFQSAILTTALFVVLCVPGSMILGFALALMLNSGIRRLRVFFRAAVYLPVITNIVAAAIIWKYAFSVSGPVNSALTDAFGSAPNWYGQSGTAIGMVVLLSIWRNAGTCMVLFLAGLQAVPDEVYEAASMDGANRAQRIFSVVIPLLRPTTLLVTVLMTVSFLNIFEEPYLLTRGGPLAATQSIALWVYQQFGFGNVAVSMAGSVLMLVLVGAVAAVQFRLLRPKH